MRNQLSLLSLACLVSFHAMGLSPAGKTMIAKGTVSAYETESDQRKLQRRSPIFDVDTVETQADSKAQFRMRDGTLLALKQNSKLLISEYDYNDEQGGGSAVLELVEGGLRSVTGAIKANNGEFELKTPVGSIGIRGTHFEIELIDGSMFLAVWDGAIDLTIQSGAGTDTVSFGEGEDFSFGVVSEEGEVTELLEPPENFDQGHSDQQSDDGDEESNEKDDSDENEGSGNNNSGLDGDDNGEQDDESDDNPPPNNGDDESNEESDDDSNPPPPPGGNPPSTPPDDPDSGDDGLGDDGLGGVGEDIDTLPPGSGPGTGSQIPEPDETGGDDDTGVQEDLIEETIDNTAPTSSEVIASRTGVFTYNRVVDSTVQSTAGGAGNLQISMTVDFDNGYVPDGSLSMTDLGGEWFAAFNGIINVNELDLGINFATYGNSLADGNISGFFSDGGNKITGSFNLTSGSNSANGSYVIE